MPNLTCSPASASAIFLAVFVYLPAGCLGKKEYSPLVAEYSKYFPSQTALNNPTLTTSHSDDVPSTSLTFAVNPTTWPLATISL